MREFGRRRFLAQGAALAAVSVAAKAAPDPSSEMVWFNPPAAFERKGDVLHVRSKAKTDFWRHTAIDYVADNGHFYHRTVTGKFAFEARVGGQYAAEYDQAGLMVRQDSEHWLKCGTEYFGGHRHASVVLNREFSDWSTFPDLSETSPVWWRMERLPNALNVYASADGKDFMLVRSGYFAPCASLEVGLMICAPSGPGFEAVFDRLKLA
jgi:regulation of enolase protein 1 (concanavalin A-like superfamily)